MKKILRWAPLLLFSGLCLVLAKGLFAEDQTTSFPMEKAMPSFRLAELGNPQVFYSNQDLIGEVFLLNFWATWCPSCRQEFPVLMNTIAEYEVKWIGINYKDNDVVAQEWLNTLGDPYSLILSDPDGTVGIEWGIVAAPETYLVDAQGIVRYKHIGAVTQDNWEKEIWPQVCRWSDNAYPRCKKP